MMTFQGLNLSTLRAQGLLKKAQNALDTKCIALMEPYVPEARDIYQNHGKMKRSHKQESPGIIINTEPRARREYYINKGGSGGLRGKYWFERMKSDHMQELLKAAQEEIT